MKLTFSDSATIRGERSVIWQIVTDVANWSRWDPHIIESGMEGRFEPGAEGWSRVPGSLRGKFKVRQVDPERGYSTESPMPMGTMYVTARYEEVAPGRVTVSRTYELHGGFVPIFKLFYLRAVKKQLAGYFPGLEEEARRKSAVAGADGRR